MISLSAVEFISSTAVFSYVLLLCWSISRREQNKIQARSFACGLDLSCYFLHFMIRSEYGILSVKAHATLR